MQLDRLAHVVPTGRLGNPKGLPDDVLKVRVHTDMRAQPAAKEKPRRSGSDSAQPSRLVVEFAERVMDTLGDRDPAEQRQ